MDEGRPAFDAAAFKAATREQWDRTGKGWNDQTPHIRAWLAEATAAMIRAAGVRPGMRALDVAAGAGDQTLDLARAVGPEGRVLATDLSAGILAYARENARRAGLSNIETRVVDGESLGCSGEGFDVALNRLGLMLFPDPLRALGEMHVALRPNGRACALVFSEPEANPCVVTVSRTALQHAGLPPRDPFQPGGLLSLGRPGHLASLFEQAGYRSVRTERLAAPFRLPTVEHYMEFIRTSTGPILQILARLDDTARAAAWSDIEERLSEYQTPAGWVGPNELLLVVGMR
jgi:SAM-dependent methyltransferase